jgi:hypothetical protein
MAVGGLQTPDGVDGKIMDFVRAALVSAVVVNADDVAGLYYGGALMSFNYAESLPNVAPAFKSLWIDMVFRESDGYKGSYGNALPESVGALLYANVILKPDDWRSDIGRWKASLKDDLAEVISAWESAEIRWTYEVFLFVSRGGVPLGPVVCISVAVKPDGALPMTSSGKPAMICKIYSKKKVDGTPYSDAELAHYAAEAADLLKPVFVTVGLLNSKVIGLEESARPRAVGRKIVKTGSPLADKPYYKVVATDEFSGVWDPQKVCGRPTDSKSFGVSGMPGAFWWVEHF